MTTAARDLALEQAARALSVAKDRRLPQPVRNEAGEITSELVTIANQIGPGSQRSRVRRLMAAAVARSS